MPTDVNTSIHRYLKALYRDTNTDLETLASRWLDRTVGAGAPRSLAHLGNIAQYDISTIGTLVFWLACDSSALWTDVLATTRVSASGDAVKAWTELVTGFLVTEPTNPPTFTPDVLHGFPAVRFDGTNDLLAFSVNTRAGLFRNVAGATGIVVVTSTFSGTTVQSAYGVSTNSSGNSRFVHELNRTSNGSVGAQFRIADADSVSTQASAGSQIVSGSPHVSTIVMDASTATFQTWANGTSAQGPTDLSASLTAGNYSDTNPAKGNLGRAVGTANFLNGDIFEILLFNSALSTATRQLVERYLGTKYGITVA